MKLFLRMVLNLMTQIMVQLEELKTAGFLECLNLNPNHEMVEVRDYI